MEFVLRGLTWNQVLVYFDDVVILGKDFDDCTHNLREALLTFRKYSMKLKPKKCELFRHEVEFKAVMLIAPLFQQRLVHDDLPMWIHPSDVPTHTMVQSHQRSL
jgi:hypothetical protein